VKYASLLMGMNCTGQAGQAGLTGFLDYFFGSARFRMKLAESNQPSAVHVIMGDILK